MGFEGSSSVCNWFRRVERGLERIGWFIGVWVVFGGV